MMFGILKILSGNLGSGPATLRFPQQAPVPADLRGMVRMDPGHCRTCGICAYVCPSGAIAAGEGETAYGWSYDPGRCTFCARCAERCPGRAITLDPEPVPAYRRRGELATAVQVPYPACPDCGRPVHQGPGDWLSQACPGDEGTRELLRLCLPCRRRRTQAALKSGMGGKL
jgi:formate hydrogenlyase subunit 6/NADH:ubiquinone oxidoreductase subunit I